MKKIFIWIVITAGFIIMAYYAYIKLDSALLAAIVLIAPIALKVLYGIFLQQDRNVKVKPITEVSSKVIIKEVAPQLSAEEIEKRQKATQQEARVILGAMNEWQVGEIRSMYLYVKKHNYDPSMPLSLYKSTNTAEYELLKDKLIQRNAVKHIGNQLLDFTSLGYSICELAVNKESRQK